MVDSKTYVPGYGPMGTKIMFLGDAPRYADVVALKPFSGTDGKELKSICYDAGYNPQQAWLTTVSKYYVPPSPKDAKPIPFVIRAKNAGVNLDQQIEELANEINSVNPNVIVAMGNTALWALTGKQGINDWRGSILRGGGRKVIPTFHPDHLSFHASDVEFKGYWNRFMIVFDIKRAIEESHTREIELPSRNLYICKSSAQLSEFITRHKGMVKPAVDIEAAGTCVPTCIGVAFTPKEGICVPLWPNDAVQIFDAEYVSLWRILGLFLAQQDVVGQNFKYDEDKIRRLGFIIRSLASDTMLKAFAINPELPKRLAFNQSIYTREPFYKNEGMYEGTLADLFIGCARDACVTKEIDLAMDVDLDEIGQRKFYENFLLHLHPMYLAMEQEGFMVDYQARDSLFKKYIAWSEKLQYELFKIVGDHVNINSPKQVATMLFEVLKCPRRAGTGEEELTALLNNVGKTGVHKPEQRRAIEIVLEKRRVEKTISTYLMALPDYDGKMKTTYYLCNETGRTSTGQLEPPIRPVYEYRDEKNKPKKKNIGIAFQTMTKHGDIGQDVRSQYIAEPGYIFVQADSAQAEARVVFLLANDEQALEDIDARDYHALTASWFFGGTEDDYSKKKLGYEHPIRFAGKTLRHAGHLGAGKRRAAISVNTDARKFKIPITIDEGTAERALKIFHSKQPRIQQVFQAGVAEAISKTRILHAGIPYGFDIDIGGRRTFYGRYDEELLRQAYSYIPQRSITDNTKAAGLRLRKREPRLCRIIMESHDSLLFAVPERELDYFTPMIKEEMERPIRFENCTISRRDLVVPCELETGYNYMELHKFKFKFPIIQPPKQELTVRPRTTQEQFEVR